MDHDQIFTLGEKFNQSQMQVKPPFYLRPRQPVEHQSADIVVPCRPLSASCMLQASAGCARGPEHGIARRAHAELA